MNNRLLENMFLIGILIYLLLCITSLSHSKVSIIAKAVPFGSTSWEWRGGQDWIYSKQTIMAGVGFSESLYEDVFCVAKQYLVIDDLIGPSGIRGEYSLFFSEVIKVSYTNTYRWYEGSGSDYGYATGGGWTHKLEIELDVPIF